MFSCLGFPNIITLGWSRSLSKDMAKHYITRRERGRGKRMWRMGEGRVWDGCRWKGEVGAGWAARGGGEGKVGRRDQEQMGDG